MAFNVRRWSGFFLIGCGALFGVARAADQTNGVLAKALELRPTPWTDGERMRLDIKKSGSRIGVLFYTAQAAESKGSNFWRLESHMFAGIEQFSRVEVHADSLVPVHSHWKHTLLGDVEVAYSTNQVHLSIKGKEQRTIEPGTLVYDHEEIVPLLRRLPLETNFTRTVNVIAGLLPDSSIPLKIEVSRIERVWVPAGEFDCFRVELSNNQTFWISTDAHRYIVKVRTPTADAELVQAERVNLNEAAVCWNKESGMYLTAPPGWTFFEAEGNDFNHKIYILDPEATAHTWLTVRTKDKLLEEAKDSLRVWAENALPQGELGMMNIVPREGSWQNRTIAASTGLSVIADFLDRDEKKVAYQVVALVGPKAVTFTSHIPATDFDTMMQQIKIIVNLVRSY